MAHRRTIRREGPGWRGFTLIELLVVIFIMAILMALGAAAVLRFMGAQQVDTTRDELRTFQRQLDSQWQQVTRTAKDEGIPATAQSWITNNVAGNDANASYRARVIYIKLKQRQAFPMTFDEALNPWPLPPLQPYVAYLNGLGITGSSPQTQDVEPAVCLLMALERSPGGGGVAGEDLGPFVADIPLPNGKTARGLVDAWRQPLWFCRWPTDQPDLNLTGPGPGSGNDPSDPQGLLNSAPWVGTGAYTPPARAFQNLLHKVPLRNGPTSYRLAPVIASAGPDRATGLDLRTFAPQGTQANDNLYSVTQP